MKELLYSPTMYGKINLIIQAKFKSNYGLALYENCVRYQGLEATRWFEYEMFRHLMGIPNNKYLVFRDFKKRVLDKSIDEVNTYSNLNVTLELKRQGRKVVRLRFKLKEREKKQRLGKEVNYYSNEPIDVKSNLSLVNILVTQFNLAEEQINKLIGKYREDKIKQAIDFARSQPQWVNGKIKNPAGFLVSILQGQIKSSYEPSKITRDRELEENLSNTREIKEQYNQYITETIDQVFQGLSSKIQRSLEKEFIAYLEEENNSFILCRIKETGFTNEMVKAYFRNYLITHKRDIIPALPSYEEFKQGRASFNEM
jgi:hypothetical protein